MASRCYGKILSQTCVGLRIGFFVLFLETGKSQKDTIFPEGKEGSFLVFEQKREPPKIPHNTIPGACGL